MNPKLSTETKSNFNVHSFRPLLCFHARQKFTRSHKKSFLVKNDNKANLQDEVFESGYLSSNLSSDKFQKKNSPRIKRQKLMSSSKLGRTKITVMLVVVVFFFFLCQFPNLIIHILQSLYCEMELSYKCRTHGLFAYGYVLSKFLIVTNLSFNFWCYCVFSEKFREIMKEIFFIRNQNNIDN